jgi:short subunit dehydrogenase-like uncharacterized protein
MQQTIYNIASKAMNKPTYDVVVFGATSFVGQILCRYLLQEFGSAAKPGARQLNWAIAGRSRTKLDELLATLKTSGKNVRDIPIIVADAADEKALSALCVQTRVVISTVGPYALYGEPLIKACTDIGTDYCDLSGEVPWMARMIERYSAVAKKSGARIVHCCGFDSIPSDMGVWFLQQQSLRHYGEPCAEINMRVKAIRGAASGGTVASLVNVVREAASDAGVRRIMSDPYSLCPASDVNENTNKTRQTNLKGASFDTDLQSWSAPFVMAAINTRVVLRSNAIMGYPYGKDFRYNEARLTGKGFRGRARAVATAAGLAGFVASVALKPTRWLMEKFVLPAAGEGPSPDAQEKGFYDLRFIGRTADGRELHAKVKGDRDPGYGSTGKMIGEAAACLALDIAKADVGGGFWTPSSALGEPLYERLKTHAGLTFTLIE